MPGSKVPGPTCEGSEGRHLTCAQKARLVVPHYTSDRDPPYCQMRVRKVECLCEREVKGPSRQLGTVLELTNINLRSCGALRYVPFDGPISTDVRARTPIKIGLVVHL